MVEALDILSPVLDRIADRAATHDIGSQWPQADLDDLASIGAMRWAIGKAWGGDDLDGPTLHDHYELIASASLATALILSQRDAAAEFIESSSNEPLRDRLLPQLVQNKVWSTIGISHLTTSHQSGTLTAEWDGDGFLVNGTIPWATGACKSDFIVAVAKTLDGQQLLFVLPVDLPGVTVLPPLKLATLAAAPTSPVRCAAVRIGPDLILSGPSEAVLVGRSRNVAISQAFAAFGIIRASLQLIKQIDIASAANSHDLLSQQFRELRSTVHDANARLAGGRDLQSGPLIRSECSNLASRAAQSAVTLYKGSALKLDHPAQRLAREALFLLVWSSPMSVVDRTLELIADPH